MAGLVSVYALMVKVSKPFMLNVSVAGNIPSPNLVVSSSQETIILHKKRLETKTKLRCKRRRKDVLVINFNT
jgi:hypothetical protein